MSETKEIDLRRFFRTVKRLKWVNLAIFLIIMGLAATYCIIRMPQYIVKSAILIEDSSNDGLPKAGGGMLAMMKTFSVGGFGSSSVDNEILLVNSHDVLFRSAKLLELNRTYILRDGLEKKMLYKETPVVVEGSESMFDTLMVGMKVRIKIDGDKADITVKKGLLGKTIGKAENVKLPTTVETPYGPLRIRPTDFYSEEPSTIDVSVSGYENAAMFLAEEIDVDVIDKLADGIGFEMLYPDRDRGKAILNTIMGVYNDKRLNRKHSTAEAEIKFLDSRINELFSDLTDVEKEVEKYKKENNLAAIEEEASVLVESSIETQGEVVKAQAQILYYEELLKSLKDEGKQDDVLPVFDGEAYPMFKDYNELVLQKKDLERSAKKGNPALETATKNLAELRKSVIQNVEGLLDGARLLVKTQSGLLGTASSRLKKLPTFEREYINLYRDQKLKNELYVFLLEKRESAVLQLYSQNTLGFIIDEAYTEPKPSKKKSILVLLGALALSLICVAAVTIWYLRRKDFIYDPADLAFIGLENRCVTVASNPYGISDLRNSILRISGSNTIYVAAFGDYSSVFSELENGLIASGRKIKSISVFESEDSDGNTPLLTPEFNHMLLDEESKNDIIFVRVPDPLRLGDLTEKIMSDNDTTLILAPKGEVVRQSLRQLLKGMATDRVIVAIT